MAFRIELRRTAIIHADSQLVVGNRQDFKDAVIELLDAGERDFVIDFGATGYIDSSGLGVLFSISRKIREKGGRLRVRNLDHAHRMLFELTRVDRVIEVEDAP